MQTFSERHRVASLSPQQAGAQKNGPREQNADALWKSFQAVQRLISECGPDKAIIGVKDFLTKYPNYAPAHNNLGMLYYQQGDRVRALMHYERAVSLQPDNTSALRNLADFYYTEMNRIEDAQQLYAAIIALQANDLETLQILANICVSLKQFRAAAFFYARVLDLAPEREDARKAIDAIKKIEESAITQEGPELQHKEAMIFVNAGLLDKAISLLEDLLKSHPEFALAHNDLGVLHGNKKDFQKAKEHYEAAVKLHPQNIMFAKNLADVLLLALGRVDEAIEMYSAILALQPNETETLAALGQAYMQQKNTQQAAAVLGRLLEIDPDNAAARDALAAMGIKPVSGTCKTDQKPSGTEGAMRQYITDAQSKRAYDEMIKHEKEHFDAALYNPQTLTEKTPEGLGYILEHYNKKLEQDLGLPPWDYVAAQINKVPNARILSIGSGPCGLEISIAKKLTGQYVFECMDINEPMLQCGQAKARQAGLNLVTTVQDANLLRLTHEYDVILAHASLHHFINLEEIFREIHNHLKPEGLFFVMEATPRNGMLLWPEEKQIINSVLAHLPARLRFDHVSQTECIEFPERDTSQGGFECIRSQDIIPTLEAAFDVLYRRNLYGVARRFVDRGFGENYNMTNECDKTLVDTILAFDEFCLERGALKPGGIFMILGRKDRTGKERVKKIPSLSDVSFGEGFHGLEGKHRWMERRGTMRVKQEVTPALLSFDLSCDKAEQYADFPFDVSIFVGEESVHVFNFNAETRTHAIQLLVEQGSSDVEICLESNASFVPAKLGISNDCRELSVRLSDLAIRSIDTDPANGNHVSGTASEPVSAPLPVRSSRFVGVAKDPAYAQALEEFAKNPTVLIELSSKCNFHCNYCRSAQSARQKSFMKKELFMHLLGQLKDITTQAIRLHVDGEPTLHPSFLELALQTNKAGHSIALATNGSILKPEFLQIDDMRVILNLSCSPEELRMRSAMKFSQYLDQITHYVLGWKNSSNKQDIHLKIYTSLRERENPASIEGKKQFAADFVRKLGITQAGQWSESSGNPSFSYSKQRGQQFTLTIQAQAEGGLYPNPSNVLGAGMALPNDYGFCDSPWKVLAVLSDGTVSCCCVDVTGETGFTRPEEIWHTPLKEIWLKHPEIRKVRDNFLSGNVTFPICGKCLEVVPNREFYLFPEIFPYPKKPPCGMKR